MAKRQFSGHYGCYWRERTREGDYGVPHVERCGEAQIERAGNDHSTQDAPLLSGDVRRRMPTKAAISALDIHQPENIDSKITTGHRKAFHAQDPKSSRIHILGTGKDGKFVAHSLAAMGGRPPITLLLHRPLLIQQWYEEGQVLEFLKDGKPEIQIGFDVEDTRLSQAEHAQGRMLSAKSVLSSQGGWTIDQLIVTTPAPVTSQALYHIKDRLHPTTTICFLQNGMGLIDEVNHRLFPNTATRPRYIEGMTSHGLQNHPSRTFTAAQYRRGDIFLASQDGDLALPTALPTIDSTRSLLRTLTRSPILNAKGTSPTELLVLKLERLAVEAVIGPLSVMFDCKNGDLLSNYMVTQLLREILREISLVVSALPELRDFPQLKSRFEPERLERMFFHVASKTSGQLSDMVQSVRKGERSEIGYFTGYILKRASQLGIECPSNTLMIRMVKAKTAMKSREANHYVPFQGAKES